MRFFDLLALIAYNLARRKGRVALTAIGVIIGTASVVLLVALATGLQRNATNQFAGMTDMTLITVQQKFDMGPMAAEVKMGGGGGGGGGGGNQPGQTKTLTTRALDELTALQGVQSIIPRDVLRNGGRVKVGRLETYPFIFALGTDDLTVMGYKLKNGEGTLALEKGTALIGEAAMKSFQDPMWRPGQPQPEQPNLLGKTVRLLLQRFNSDGTMTEKAVQVRIVGVLPESRSETDYAMVVRMDELTTWNEWSNMKRINRTRDPYDVLYVKATDSKVVTDLAQTINDAGYMAYTQLTFVEGINNFYTIIQVVFGGIGAIALLVAAIGIANTMTMAILERTREIGLMKAVGATNRNVLSIFLGEAAGIGLVGGLGGVILSWIAAQVINVVAGSYLAAQSAQMGSLNPPGPAAYIAPWLPVFALGFSTLVGLLSGLYPALRAATMIPVMALKYE